MPKAWSASCHCPRQPPPFLQPKVQVCFFQVWNVLMGWEHLGH